MADNFSDEQLAGYAGISLDRVAYDNYRLTEEVKKLTNEIDSLYKMVIELKKENINLKQNLAEAINEISSLRRDVDHLID